LLITVIPGAAGIRPNRRRLLSLGAIGLKCPAPSTLRDASHARRQQLLGCAICVARRLLLLLTLKYSITFERTSAVAPNERWFSPCGDCPAPLPVMQPA
jgi:hypothetical protein